MYTSIYMHTHMLIHLYNNSHALSHAYVGIYIIHVHMYKAHMHT